MPDLPLDVLRQVALAGGVFDQVHLAARRPGYPRPSAPRIEIRGLCSPGDPPSIPWQRQLPFYGPSTPAGAYQSFTGFL
jgi:hypothetical protein